ncbi:MAG TPA: hypothetical protein VF526_20125 [Solirubrobacteraceae bacterium]|jgi:hypothetical protein
MAGLFVLTVHRQLPVDANSADGDGCRPIPTRVAGPLAFGGEGRVRA